MKKLLIINAIVAGSFLLGIGGVLADGCKSNDECPKDKPYCTVAGPITANTVKHCAENQLKNSAPTPTNRPITTNPITQNPCNETLVPQKPTQQSAEKPKPSVPADKPTSSFINPKISCVGTVLGENNIKISSTLRLIIHICAYNEDISACLSDRLQKQFNEKVSQELNKCAHATLPENTQASVWDTLWKFVTHRR